jgi:xanthine dehydrogenase accessory factor
MLVSTHLFHLLRQLREDQSPDWVLATVVTKVQSSYRQPGAMMLVHPEGQSLGLVSGGCLEADIRLNARKVLALDQGKCILYDDTEEGSNDENIAAELGLGCNGRVEILVQPLRAEQRKILLQLLDRMEHGQDSYLLQCFQSDSPSDLDALVLLDDRANVVARATERDSPNIEVERGEDSSVLSKHCIVSDADKSWSLNRHNHPIKLWVIGGGVDAQPLVKMAASLGWQVSVVDHRPAYGQELKFPLAAAFIRGRPEDLKQSIDADAVLLMSHNLRLDAAWLARIKSSTSLRYIGLLGPVSRKHEVLKQAKIDESSELIKVIHGPMGFDIGGDLPESVALSTLAECHQVLFKEDFRRK